MQRRSWHDLSGRQRTALKIAAVVQYALLAAALIDLRFRDPARVRGSKKVWAAVSMVNYVGPAAYFIWGRKRDA